MTAVTDSQAPRARWAIDVLLERYVSWREECRAVRRAYQWWVDSERRHRELAYAGYLAALDREEHAARAYADQIELVARMCI
jgi:hypothetical protein